MRWGFLPVWKAFMTMTMAHNEKQNWRKDNLQSQNAGGNFNDKSQNQSQSGFPAAAAGSNSQQGNNDANTDGEKLEDWMDSVNGNAKNDTGESKRKAKEFFSKGELNLPISHTAQTEQKFNNQPEEKHQSVQLDLDLDLDLLDTDIELEWDTTEKDAQSTHTHFNVNCTAAVEEGDAKVQKLSNEKVNETGSIYGVTEAKDSQIEIEEGRVGAVEVQVTVETIEKRKLVRSKNIQDFCDSEKVDGETAVVQTENIVRDEGGDNQVFQDKWKILFDKFDPEGFGEMPWSDFLEALKSKDFLEHVQPGQLQLLKDLALVYSAHSTAITFQHFVNIMSGKRSRSFKCALHQRDREVCSESDFHLLPVGYQPPSGVKRMARLIADEFLTDERDRKYYADHYRCLPPPLFIISVTLIELGFFTYYTIWHGEISSSGPLPMDSPFVYRPDKRHEVWRFIFYMVLHSGWVHLMFNLLVQLLVGLPLEMVHGSLRIGAVYMAGVLAGSLGTSVFDPDVYLVGASGGVYALLAAHLANVLINYNNMEFGLVRLVSVFLIASVDVGFAIYDRYAAASGLSETTIPAVSYVAHLAGAVAGLTIGLLVLKNFEQKLREQLMWWLALGVYAACTLFAILFNIFHPVNPEVIPSDFVELPGKFPSPN